MLKVLTEKIDIKKALEYQPYLFYKRFEFLEPKIGSPFFIPFGDVMFLREIKIIYPRKKGANLNSDLLFELYNLCSDQGFQSVPFCSFTINSFGNDIDYTASPDPVDNINFSVNFTASTVDTTMKLNIPMELNSPIHFYITAKDNTLPKPEYIDFLAHTQIKTGNI